MTEPVGTRDDGRDWTHHLTLGLAAVTRPDVDDRAIEVPLVHAQQWMWARYRDCDHEAGLHLSSTLVFEGAVDLIALDAAVWGVVNRHEILRTNIAHRDDSQCQVVRPIEAVQMPLSAIPTSPEDIEDALSVAASRRFRLHAEIPVRFVLLAAGPAHHTLLIVLHGVAGDRWALGQIADEVLDAYAAHGSGRPGASSLEPVRHGDHMARLRAMLGDETHPESLVSRQLAFWQKQVDGMPARIPLPLDEPRESSTDTGIDGVDIVIAPRLHQGLVALAGELDSTLSLVLLAAFAALLSRLGAGHDIPIVSTVPGRVDAGPDTFLGWSGNVLVLRIDTAGNPSFGELLDRVGNTDRAARTHRDIPFDLVVQRACRADSGAPRPPFQVMMATHRGPPHRIRLGELDVSVRPHRCDSPGWELGVSFDDQTDRRLPLTGRMSFMTPLFRPESMRMMVARYQQVLTSVVGNPGCALDDIDVLTEDERRLLRDWNDTSAENDASTIIDLFRECAENAPDAVAVLSFDGRLTYRELASWAEHIAHGLVYRGVGPDDIVGVLLPRSAELVAAILGTLWAGAAYLPLDPTHPSERIAYLLADARPALVLTSETIGASHGLARELQVPVDRTHAADVAAVCDATGRADLDSAAYVMYTSGSAGSPKAVVVTHRSLANYTVHCVRSYRGLSNTVTFHSPPSFDFSITSLFGTLASGGTLVVAELGGSPPSSQPAFLKVTPSQFDALYPDGQSIGPTEELMFGGEPLTAETVLRCHSSLPGTAIVNHYGPTECTVGCVQWRVSPGTIRAGCRVPIGRPIRNLRAYVLDHRLRPIPIGVPGELYLGGAGLARGYLGRPAQTAERFVPDPFGPPGSRMYRSGDVARWTIDGTLEFHGRSDDQIKLHGFRIEPTEIEAALRRHPAVARATAVVREDQPHDRRLVAYVVAQPGLDVEPIELRELVGRWLPHYLIPSHVVLLEQLPTLPNGKLDRRALPVPARQPVSRTLSGQQGSRQQRLCSLFAAVLGVERVGVDDNFFDLGGHSILAIQLVSRIRKAFEVDLTIRDFFNAPTAAALARSLDTFRSLGGPLDTVLPLRSAPDPVPLFCIHPAAGLSWCYLTLLGHLDPGMPVIGIQADGLTPARRLAGSVEEMARRYAGTITETSGDGPHCLLGWSFGGVVAHAVAAELQGWGLPVAFLAMIDSYVHRHRPFDPSTGEQAALAAAAGHPVGRVFDNRLTGIPPEDLAAIRQVFYNNERISQVHHPPLFEGDVFYVQSRLSRVSGATADCWLPHITGSLNVIVVDHVNHYEMMTPGAVRTYGSLIDAELGRILRH